MNNIMWRLLNAGYRLINPQFWIQNHPTCYKYDQKIREAVQKGGVRKIGMYRCEVNGVEIWIENYPFAFGCIPSIIPENRVLPSPLTRKMIKKMVDPEHQKRKKRNKQESLRFFD